MLTPRRIKINGPLSPNFNFESGVVNIQGGMDNLLDDDKKAAVRTLLMDENGAEEDKVAAEESRNDDDSFDALLGPDDDPTLGIRNQNQTLACINCSFVFGSCTEVESSWSITKHTLTDNRKGTIDPVVF